MKKSLVAVMALCLASSAYAAVGVEFGTNWYRVNYSYNTNDHFMGQGQNMLVYWGLDNDITVGAYAETTMLSDGYGNVDSFEVSAIQIAKGIVKNVNIGLNIGRFYEEWDDETGMLTDVFGSVVILSGASEKVTGTVKATVAARFGTDEGEYTWDGAVVGLSVGLAF